MRMPRIPDRSDYHGLDEVYDPPTGDEKVYYGLGCSMVIVALVLFGLVVTGALWWAGLL